MVQNSKIVVDLVPGDGTVYQPVMKFERGRYK
jgi:hypothetical protein